MPVPKHSAAPARAVVALADREATRRLARRLARLVRPGDVIGLGGDLGVGKTTLARDFIDALAGARQEVPSPTYTLVQTYEVGGLVVWHFDLWRIAAPHEAFELGFEDALAGGVSLIEWPERLGPLLPADWLDVTLDHGPAPDARVARFAAHGVWIERLPELIDD